MTEIVIAVITGVFSVIGITITNISSNKNIEHKIEVAQAVTDTKVEELTREVRKHNNFAERMPVVEQEIKELNRRVENLERGE